jgi:nucleoprotein TPR
LGQERERAVQAATSEAQHAELVERINQLALLRESNATLRADCEASAKRARELDARLKEVSAELDPVKDQLRQARGEIEARDARVQRLEAESTSWQERNRQLLSKVRRSPWAMKHMWIDGLVRSTTASTLRRCRRSRRKSRKPRRTRPQWNLPSRSGMSRSAPAPNAYVYRTRIRLVPWVEPDRTQIEALEATNARITETGKRNNGIFKKKMEAAEQERTQSAETIAALQAQVAQLQQERDALAAQMEAAPTADGQAVLAGQIDTLIRENANLERALAEAKAVSATGAAQEEADAEIVRVYPCLGGWPEYSSHRRLACVGKSSASLRRRRLCCLPQPRQRWQQLLPPVNRPLLTCRLCKRSGLPRSRSWLRPATTLRLRARYVSYRMPRDWC